MKIGNTGNNSLQSASPVANSKNEDSQTKSIKSQIAKVQEQLRSLNGNKEMSMEAKMERRKELQQQLQDLNKQLSQREIEKRKEEQEKRAKELQEQAEKTESKQNNKRKSKEGMVENSAMKGLISAGTSMKQVNTANAVKTKLEGSAGVLETEIKLDGARGGVSDNKIADLANIESKIDDVTSDMMGQLSDIIESVSDETEKTNEGHKTNKTEDKEKTEGKDKRDKFGNPEELAADNEESTAGTLENYVPIDVKL